MREVYVMSEEGGENGNVSNISAMTPISRDGAKVSRWS